MPDVPKDNALTAGILGLWWREDLDHDDLLWSVEDGRLLFAADCSDFFEWGTADCEDIDEASLPVLQQAVADAKELGEEGWGSRLYAARRRGMRPQGAYYHLIPAPLWPLFDACGPERVVDLGNPRVRPVVAGAES